MAVESMSNRSSYLGNKCNISKDDFLKALNLILDSIYFQCDNCFYKQKFDTPIGSPLSLLVNLVLQDVKISTLKDIGITLLVLFQVHERYCNGIK